MKSLAVLLTIFISFQIHSSYGQSAIEAFSDSGLFGLRNADNQEIILPPQYEKIGWSDGLQLPVGQVIGYYDDAWGIMTTDGKKITEARYYTLQGIHKQFIIASVIGRFSNELLYGAINAKGKVQLDFKFHSIEPCGDLLIVSQRSKNQTLYGLYNDFGIEVLPVKYRSIRHYDYDLFVFENNHGKKGIIRKDGKVIRPADLDELGELREHRALINKRGGIGLVDSIGHVLSPPIYKSIEQEEKIPFSSFHIYSSDGESKLINISADSIVTLSDDVHGVFRNGFLTIMTSDSILFEKDDVSKLEPFRSGFLIHQDKHLWFLNEHGRTVFKRACDRFKTDSRHIFLRSKGYWNIWNYRGEKVNKWKLRQVLTKSDTLIPVKRDRYWGYISENGQIAVNIKYDTLEPFVGKIARARYLGFDVVIKPDGQIVGEAGYDRVTIINENMIIAKIRSRQDLLNSNGSALLQTYNDLEPIHVGYIEKTEAGTYGFIDSEGNTSFNPVYDSIRVMDDKYLHVQDRGQNGLALIDGTWLIPLSSRYESIGEIGGQKIGVMINGAWGFVNLRRQLLIANRYEQVKAFRHDMTRVKMNGKWGLINQYEKILLQPNLDSILVCGEHTFITIQKHKYGLVNDLGKQLIQSEYDEMRLDTQDHLTVRQGTKYGLFDQVGKQLIPVSFDQIIDTSSSLYIVQRRGKYGVMNAIGRYIIPLKYDMISPSGSSFICRKNP